MSKSCARWTADEDNWLRKGVEEHGMRNWKQIAKQVSQHSTRQVTDNQCTHRWKIIAPGVVKGMWSKEEDDLLFELVPKITNSTRNKWSWVALHMVGRTGKQCRDRWINQLDPSINRGPWTCEEDQILVHAHSQFGNAWSTLATMLPGRTENAVKNRWNSCALRNLRGENPFGAQTQQEKQAISALVELQDTTLKRKRQDE